MKKYIVKLSSDERRYLEGISQSRKTATQKVQKAKILLKVDQSESSTYMIDEEAGKLVGTSYKTVANVRKTFVMEGMEAVLNRKKYVSIARTSKISGEEEAHLIALCCSSPPEGRARWTLKLLSSHLVAMDVVESVSSSTVQRALKKNELKPWKKKDVVHSRRAKR